LIDAYFDAAAKLFTLWPMLALILGITIGLINGALPAGGSIPLLVILMGFAYGMDPAVAIPLVIGAMAVNGTTDPIPCILLGIPGSASAQATILDGHPLAQQGRAGYALSVAYTSSLIGGLIGAVALALFVPVARSFLTLFGSVEFFALALIGIAIVGVVSTGAMIKGLLGAAFGLAIALIGVDPITGTERLVAVEYLWEGIPLVPAIVGLFAIPEILDLVVSDRPIARKALDLEKVQADIRSQRGEGIRETFRHKFLVLRASLIGLFVGMMPGVGGSVAHWLAYAQARQTEKGAFKTFGTGDIRGVIAPESANNSIDAGVLMPTVAFGIPGSGQMSIFLGFLILTRIAAWTGDVEPAFASDFADGMVVGSRQRDRHGGGALLHAATGAHRRHESQCAGADRSSDVVSLGISEQSLDGRPRLDVPVVRRRLVHEALRLAPRADHPRPGSRRAAGEIYVALA
jgi:TctA family transporter